MTKLVPAKLDAFLKQPDTGIRAVLIYGPDGGLVRERADRLARAICPDLKDPFRVAELTQSALSEDHDLLTAEAAQMSLMGGRRLVRLREAGDTLGALFQRFFKAPPPGDGFVLVEAGDLAARSSLRKAFEGATTAAAIACYADNLRDLQGLVREVMAAHRIKISSEAGDYLADHLGGDRGVSRQELEKLALYAGDGGSVGLEDAAASVGDSAALELDDVIMATAEGNGAALERALGRLFQEGDAPVTILRAAARHFQRLHLAAVAVERGLSPEEAVRNLRPPVFFKLQDRIKAQLRFWQPRRVQGALELLTEAELNAKRTGMPGDTICRDALIRIARRVAEARRRG